MRPLAAFLVATAFAAPLAASDIVARVTLLEPSPYEELVAGSTAIIAWDASNLPPNVEEWEAFLSIDGGRTYHARLTPHLHDSIRRFSWRVPNLPGADVTIMLRFGDERDETSFVFPLGRRISGDVRLLQTISHPEPAPVQTEPNAEGVVRWVDGARDGSGLREVSAASNAILACGTPRVSNTRESLVSVAVPGGCKPAVRPMSIVNAAFARHEGRSRAVFVGKHAGILALSGRMNV